MARPKKPRFFEGVQLADNLYRDSKRRIGYWWYILPDGKKKVFQCDSVKLANEYASNANSRRETYRPKKNPQALTPLGHKVADFIAYREQIDPDLKLIRSWENRCYALHKFARQFTKRPRDLTRNEIQAWWDTLSHFEQKLRHAEFRKFFNFMMGNNLTPQLTYNPFTTSDERPRLYAKSKPKRKRARLDIKGFWAIYSAAEELNYEGLQVAMGLSLVTFMREQDILSLRFDEHCNDGYLQRTISKSEAQRGFARASRLQWNIETHALLKPLLEKAKKTALHNGNCPFLVSHMPKRIYKSRTKKHPAQLTKERLGEQFRDARSATGLWTAHPNPPTFHEIRSLSDAMASKAGIDISTIQHAMAHGNSAMTALYQANHDLPYEEVAVVFTPEMLDGRFS